MCVCLDVCNVSWLAILHAMVVPTSLLKPSEPSIASCALAVLPVTPHIYYKVPTYHECKEAPTHPPQPSTSLPTAGCVGSCARGPPHLSSVGCLHIIDATSDASQPGPCPFHPLRRLRGGWPMHATTPHGCQTLRTVSRAWVASGRSRLLRWRASSGRLPRWATSLRCCCRCAHLQAGMWVGGAAAVLGVIHTVSHFFGRWSNIHPSQDMLGT